MFPTQLPLEIFKVITAYLTDEQVLTCQTVCSAWYKKWIAYKYHHVHIKGKLQFQSFLSTLQHSLYKPGTTFSVGYQIRKLIIENGHIDPDILGQLPSLCPYLEVFMFDGVTLGEAARREPFQHYQQQRNKEALDKVKHHLSKWSQMRHLAELNGITVPLALLSQPTNLVSISVQFNNQNDRTNRKSMFLNSLHHAPFLQSFSVERIYLNMEELELIHTSCPNLKSLYLTDAVLLPNTHLDEIVPASHLEAFHFMNGSFCDGADLWLDYISRKYINAKTINIGICSFSSENGDITIHESSVYEPQLVQIAKRCVKLKSLKLQCFSLGGQFFKSLDSSGVMLNELTIGDGRTMNLIADLHGLLNSWQQHYIETLTVHGWPLTSDTRGLNILMASLAKCTSLTTLNLSLERHFYQPTDTPVPTLYLNVILEACPQLTSLSVMDAKISASDFLSTTNYALESLRFENVLIDSSSHIFQLISTQCTQLKHLSLISTIPSPIYHNTRNFNIYLPHHNLQTLVLDRVRVSRKCNARLGTSMFKFSTSNQGVMWYDLIAYECYNNRHFVYNTKSVNQVYTSDNVAVHTERMRARKVKKIRDQDISYSDLDQNVYVSVCCKGIESLYLSGLYV